MRECRRSRLRFRLRRREEIEDFCRIPIVTAAQMRAGIPRNNLHRHQCRGMPALEQFGAGFVPVFDTALATRIVFTDDELDGEARAFRRVAEWNVLLVDPTAQINPGVYHDALEQFRM